jgi:peptidoglycan hydrolase CwlO-like protein
VLIASAHQKNTADRIQESGNRMKSVEEKIKNEESNVKHQKSTEDKSQYRKGYTQGNLSSFFSSGF